METIFFRCICGNAARLERTNVDPDDAVELVVKECSACRRGTRGFGDGEYVNRNGETVPPIS